MEIDTATLDWLLAGDPAVAWQVQRDLLDKPKAVVESTRQRLNNQGWAALLLSLQD